MIQSTIWKFPLAITDEQQVEMPQDAWPLTAQFQDGVLVMWATVNPDLPRERRAVRLAGTGNPLTAPWRSRYVATVQEPSRPLVWHVFVDDLAAQPERAA